MAISPYVIKSETDPDDVKVFLHDPKPLQPVPRVLAGQAEAFLVLQPAGEGREGTPAAGVAAGRENGGEQTSA